MKKLLVLALVCLAVVNCNKDIEGCTDSLAVNYDIDATKDDGSCNFQDSCPEIGYTCIPNGIFEERLKYLGHDDVIDGQVLTANISGVDSLDVSGQDISDLTGIEDFIALTYFNCRDNQLTSLDVSQNIALTRLECYENQLTSLDVSQNTALTILRCQANQLTSLDVNQNIALTRLECYENQLTSLDVSQNTALTYLYCEFNQLTSLDVSGCTALTNLHCEINQLTSLDVSQNTALIRLECYENKLTSLDLNQNTALFWLECYYNQITSLDVSQNTALIRLSCGANQLNCLSLKNGNNSKFTRLNTAQNPDLNCIEVDDADYSNSNWLNNNSSSFDIDDGVTFSTNCNFSAGCF